VVAPILYVVPAPLSERLERYVDAGGHLVTTYFSGVVDENDHVWPGGYPGALRDLLGIRVEEFAPLLDDERVELDNGTTGTLWSERIAVTGPDVDVLLWHKADELDAGPAVTRRTVGSGSAAYVSTRLGPAGLTPLLTELLERAAVHTELPEELRGRVELAVRVGGGAEFWFLINRTGEPVQVPVADGELLHGERGPGVGRPVLLGPRAVAVLRRP
jgi:beta-galactosidase